MEALQNLTELQLACQYRRLRRILRGGGVSSIIFGLLAVARGSAGMQASPAGKGLALLGLLMLVEGIWILIAPRPSGMILEGLMFTALGLWNLTASAFGASSSLLPIAVLQLILGVKYFRRYPRFSALLKRPSQASLDWLDANVKSLARTKSSDSPDTIYLGPPAPWRARLFADAALFVIGGGREALVLSKRDVQVRQEAYDGRVAQISLQLAGQVINGTISPQHLARLSAWNQATS